MDVIHHSSGQQTLRNTIEDLPDEVLEFILGFLPPYKDLQNCKTVCKRWYNCAENVLRKTSMRLVKAVGEFNILWKKIAATDLLPTITRRFSHAACVLDNNMTNKWILVNATNSPPPMAGHSACIKDNEMVVFGGLVMSAAQNYQIQCSNEIWVLDLISLNWTKQPTTKPRPSPRYAQSLVPLDSDKAMLLGGVQTLHNRFVYSDCWILTMKGPTWTWKELAVKNKEWASANIWCNPACRVGDKIVSLSRTRHGWNCAKPLVTSAVRLSALSRPEGAPVSNKAMKIVRQLQEANKYRMAAFACDNSLNVALPENDLINQRQIAHLENRREEEPPVDNPIQRQQPAVKKIKRNTLTMHVLDISTVLDGLNLR
ncbi:hypothetical protein MSG28_002392 [Choristoneura fumiferana]|uniref:Uncharacterized protein n=1 Tax=Choristoneura fumiferana TaxID=7141 RepID=A0ACC0JVC8_CHOFU|nr:hypothetical protein MSG28_002392 [Choristoneura fumiferana]